MSEDDRNGLGATRRGLYVTAGIDTNFYGEKGTDTAIMEVQLKDSCRAPESVAPYQYLPRSDRFKKWYDGLPASERPFASAVDMERKCFLPFIGYPMATKHGFDAKKDCGRVVLRYFDEAKIKVVVDHNRDKAFYIRDRDCIEKLRGTPDDLIEMATRNQMLWMTLCNPSGNWGAAAFADNVLRALLARREPVSDEVLSKIIENARLARRSRQFEEYRDCLRQGRVDDFKASFRQPGRNLFRGPCDVPAAM